METNAKFQLVMRCASTVPTEVFSSFDFNEPVSVKEVQKQNLLSQIYQCRFEDELIVFRSVSSTIAGLLELQCEITNNLDANVYYHQ